MKLTQAGFARRYGFTLGAVRDWEQGRRQPEAAARILLKVIEKRPDAVAEAPWAQRPRVGRMERRPYPARYPRLSCPLFGGHYI